MLQTEELNLIDRSVMQALWRHADENARTVISPEELGAELHVGRKTALDALRRLRLNGWLRLSRAGATGRGGAPAYMLQREVPDNGVAPIAPSLSIPNNATVIHPQLVTEQETITPERARELLATNVENNRPLKTHRIEQYAASMSQGAWALTSDTIKIDRFGRLIDGQHRLYACIQANRPFTTSIAYGVDEAAFDYIDFGAPRTITDAVASHGLKNPGDLVSVARMVLGWRDEVLLNKEMYSRVTAPPYVLSFVQQNEAEIREAMSYATKVKRAVGGSLAPFGALALEVRRGGYAAEFDAFAKGVVSGAGLQTGDPRLALRNWISRGQGKANRSSDVLQVYVKAWNAYIEGRQNQNMKYVPGERPARPTLPARASFSTGNGTWSNVPEAVTIG